MLHYVAADLTALALALGLAAGLLSGFSLFWRGRRPASRSEQELNAALGVPMLAARPLATPALAQQLLLYWFGGGRSILPVVSSEGGTARTAAELARALAAMGVPTLLIDADFRAPALHREFGLRNRRGLADFLDGRRVELAHCTDNLSVLVAGRSSVDPLELLSRRKLQDFLAAAAKRYRVVLIDTPAAACGPDLQLFAAFGGGALVIAKRSAAPGRLEQLRKLLAGSGARVVGTVLSPA